VQFEGIEAGTPVLLDGKPVVYQGAPKFTMAAGAYEVKVMRDGQVVNRQNMEIKDQGITAVKVPQ
jgi:hypothetical protein